MFKSPIKFVIGVLLAPLAIGSSVAFYNNFIRISELSKSLNLFLWGIASYVIIHLIVYKPTYMYVLGHEAIHATTAWVLGKKIKSIKVNEQGGSVTTEGSNILVELSPYFVPLYLIVVVVVYFVVSASYNINSATFVFFMGFTLAFHIIMTVEVLKIKQPDIAKSGYIFSIVLVYTLNIVIISLIFGLLFAEFSLKQYFIDLFNVTKDLYLAIYKQLFL